MGMTKQERKWAVQGILDEVLAKSGKEARVFENNDGGLFITIRGGAAMTNDEVIAFETLIAGLGLGIAAVTESKYSRIDLIDKPIDTPKTQRTGGDNLSTKSQYDKGTSRDSQIGNKGWHVQKDKRKKGSKK